MTAFNNRSELGITAAAFPARETESIATHLESHLSKELGLVLNIFEGNPFPHILANCTFSRFAA